MQIVFILIMKGIGLDQQIIWRIFENFCKISVLNWCFWTSLVGIVQIRAEFFNKSNRKSDRNSDWESSRLKNSDSVCLSDQNSNKIVWKKSSYLLLHSAVTVFPTLEKSGIWAAFLNVTPVNLSNVSVPPSEHVGLRCAEK